MTHTTALPGAGLKLVEVQYPDRIMDIGRFRIKGWRNESGINPAFFMNDYWLDDIDKRAFHWIITQDTRIVAAARLSLHNGLEDVPYAELLKPEHRQLFKEKHIASINRMVVDPEFRREGLSTLLDRVRIERARALHADLIIAFPQLVRIAALEKRGFMFIEQLENIPEMPERPFFVMALDLLADSGNPGKTTTN
ncbi:MAG: GNAT family N-acetyltransferase [Bacteroidetes bacterium]|nr:GNAT family N-acetyltransferase [Bacteroidota bacterium]